MKSRLRALGAVLVLALLSAACTGDNDEGAKAKDTVLTPAPLGTPKPSERVAGTTSVGEIPALDAFVAIVVRPDDSVLAYVCDGKTLGAWAVGKRAGTSAVLLPKEGVGQIDVSFAESGTVSGTVALGGRPSAAFSASPAQDTAGLYRRETTSRLTGWVILADGRSKGTSSFTEPAGMPDDVTGPEASEQSSPDPMVAPTDFSSRRPSTATSEQLEKSAATGARVSVIVGLRMKFAPEGALGDKEAAQQRDRIRAAQDGLLQRLSKETMLRRYTTIPFIALSMDASDLRRARDDSEVASLERDTRYDPTLQTSTGLVGVPHAESLGQLGRGQVVAVLDTGVQSSHPFLSGKVVEEACFSSACPNGQTLQTGAGAAAPCALAGCDHGTHAAGIVAGRGSAFSGVAARAKIMAVQIFSPSDECGEGRPVPCPQSNDSDLVAGLEHVMLKRTTRPIAAVNLSLGGGRFEAHCDEDVPGFAVSVVKAAIDNLRSVGIATVVSSGNGSADDALSAPACISTAISVGNTLDDDAVAASSNSASFLNLLAPGTGVVSSVPSVLAETCPANRRSEVDGGVFCSQSGTSMAAPHVAGAWAVIKSLRPAFGVAKVLDILSRTGKSVTDSRNGVAKPRIRLDAALNCVGDVWLLNAAARESDGVIKVPVRFTSSSCRKSKATRFATPRPTVTIATSDRRALDPQFTAESGVDYSPRTQSFNGSGSFDVTLTRDTAFEPAEFFFVQVTDTGLVVGDGTAVGAIIDG